MELYLKKILLIALIAVAALGGCRAGKTEGPRLRLVVSEESRPYTAGLDASLADYQKRIGVAVDVETVSATRVMARLEEAPRPDLVLSSDPGLVQGLVARGLAGPEKWLLERYRDRVAVVARAGEAVKLERLEDLTKPEVGAIGLTEHQRSNVGMVTDTALRRAGLFAKIQARIHYYPSQEKLVEGLRRGEVAVGFIRETALKNFKADVKKLLVFDPVGEPNIPYVALGVSRLSGQPERAHQCWAALEMFFRNPAMFLIDASPAGNMLALDNLSN